MKLVGVPLVSSQLDVSPSMPLLHTVYVPPAAMVAPLAKVQPYSNVGPEPQPLLHIANVPLA